METAKHITSIKISNYRSIVEPIEIPCESKMTFLVGQNNSGKTGVLRFIGLLLNNGDISPEDSSTLTSKPTKAELSIPAGLLKEFAKVYQWLPQAFVREHPKAFSLQKTFNPNPELTISDDILKIIDPAYFSCSNPMSGWFLRDFGSASDQPTNKSTFCSRLIPKLNLPKTVYVPSLRLILQDGNPIPHFGQVEFPGQKIVLNSVVSELANLSRPYGTPSQREAARKKLSDICKFVAYCLEVQEVEITIPEAKQTIYVSIDGNEQPISNLGTGIEQLIIIGMGSFMFPNQLVLIDEPELHFHPRTQKKMMTFLAENADAKFIVATHSSAVLDAVEADIVQVSQTNSQCVGRVVQGNTQRYEAIRNLGHSSSELVLANFVIWVEGPSDRIFINNWIKKLDPKLMEGTDYAIIFYGGAVLARHEFDDGDEDLVKALSVARSFAVYMDSDRSSADAELKERVSRISSEAAKNSGMVWVSEGREIENYVPQETLARLNSFSLNEHSQYGRVWKGENFDKVRFAEAAAANWQDIWPYDLKPKMEELVKRIQQAR